MQQGSSSFCRASLLWQLQASHSSLEFCSLPAPCSGSDPWGRQCSASQSLGQRSRELSASWDLHLCWRLCWTGHLYGPAVLAGQLFFRESAITEIALWEAQYLQRRAYLLVVRRLLGPLWRQMHNDSCQQHTYSPCRQFAYQWRLLQHLPLLISPANEIDVKL